MQVKFDVNCPYCDSEIKGYTPQNQEWAWPEVVHCDECDTNFVVNWQKPVIRHFVMKLQMVHDSARPELSEVHLKAAP